MGYRSINEKETMTGVTGDGRPSGGHPTMARSIWIMQASGYTDLGSFISCPAQQTPLPVAGVT
jgi:hypothetical protein